MGLFPLSPYSICEVVQNIQIWYRIGSQCFVITYDVYKATYKRKEKESLERDSKQICRFLFVIGTFSCDATA